MFKVIIKKLLAHSHQIHFKWLQFRRHVSIDIFLWFFYAAMKRFMIAKNSVRKIQNLLVNHKSQPVTSNNVWVSFSSLSARPTDITASTDITSFNVTGSTIPPITDQEVLRLIMMTRIVNCFCGMVHKRKTLHPISS